MSTPDRSALPEGRTPTRRAVLRTGAAAWTVPVVVAATAAPAWAATGPASVSAVVVASRDAAGLLTLDVTFTNANSMPTAIFFAAVTLTPVTPGVTDFTGSTPGTNDPGYDDPVRSTIGPAVTFTYTADQQLAGNSTKKLVVTIQLAPSPGPGTVTVRGEPGGGTGATTTPGITTF